MAPAEKIVNPDEDMSGENKEFIKRWFEEVWNECRTGL
jgi:hypothetical protein